jgi:hypothetical protein
MAPTIRSAFNEVDPTLLVGGIRPLAESVEAQLSNEKLLALLSICFGVLSLALTSVGVYGVIAYAAQRRTQEIGIRLALGAGRAAVSRMMMRDVVLLPRPPCWAAGRCRHASLCTMLFAFAPPTTDCCFAPPRCILDAAAAGYLPACRAPV